MGQFEAKNDKVQSPATGEDAYRLPPELVAHLRAVLDAQNVPPAPSAK